MIEGWIRSWGVCLLAFSFEHSLNYRINLGRDYSNSYLYYATPLNSTFPFSFLLPSFHYRSGSFLVQVLTLHWVSLLCLRRPLHLHLPLLVFYSTNDIFLQTTVKTSSFSYICLPVRISSNAWSTLVESRALVSMNPRPINISDLLSV